MAAMGAAGIITGGPATGGPKTKAKLSGKKTKFTIGGGQAKARALKKG